MKPVPWCAVNDGKSKFVGFQKLIQGLRVSAPKMFHKYFFKIKFDKFYDKNL